MSFELLGEAAATSSNGNVTTTELWQEAVGGGAWLIAAATFLQGFTCLVQFSATLTDLLAPFAPGVSRAKLTLASGVALVPLCLANELSALRYSSAVGLAGVTTCLLLLKLLRPRSHAKVLLCALAATTFGSLSVICFKAVSICILNTVNSDNQFGNWETYVFIVATLCIAPTNIVFMNITLESASAMCAARTFWREFRHAFGALL